MSSDIASVPSLLEQAIASGEKVSLDKIQRIKGLGILIDMRFIPDYPI